MLVSTTSLLLFANRCDDGKEGEGKDRGEEEADEGEGENRGEEEDDEEVEGRLEEKEESASCEACEGEEACCEEEEGESIVFLNTISSSSFVFTSSITMFKLSMLRARVFEAAASSRDCSGYRRFEIVLVDRSRVFEAVGFGTSSRNCSDRTYTRR